MAVGSSSSSGIKACLTCHCHSLSPPSLHHHPLTSIWESWPGGGWWVGGEVGGCPNVFGAVVCIWWVDGWPLCWMPPPQPLPTPPPPPPTGLTPTEPAHQCLCMVTEDSSNLTATQPDEAKTTPQTHNAFELIFLLHAKFCFSFYFVCAAEGIWQDWSLLGSDFLPVWSKTNLPR